MGNQKQSKGLSRFFRSASDSNLVNNPPGATAASDSDSQSAQSYQTTLSPPPTSRHRRILNRLGWKSPLSSPLPSPSSSGVALHNTGTDHHHITTSASPSSGHASPSYPGVQSASFTAATAPVSITVSAPVNELPVSAQASEPPVSVPPVSAPPVSKPPVSAPVSEPPVSTPPVSTPPVSKPPVSAPVSEPPVSAPASEPPVSVPPVSTPPVSAQINPQPATAIIDTPEAELATDPVWTKALDMAQNKLSENDLPQLDPTKLTSELAGENIDAVVKSLNVLQSDKQKNKWRYTWRGKEVVIAERVGKILRSIEKYSTVVGAAVQCGPPVGAIVWAGIQGIMKITLGYLEVMEGFEVAIATLLEKMSICEFYSGIYNGVSLPSQSTTNSSRLQSMLDSVLPELYAAVIVFSVKARTYFEDKGVKKIVNALKPFDIEFKPFIEDIDVKEGVIRKCADAATMERVRSIEGVLQDITSVLKPISELNAKTTRILTVAEQTRELELLKMLTQLEPLKRHQDVKLPRSEGTGVWLLSLDSFIEWQNSNANNGQVFCCYGIPGAGKTVISSVVIDALRSKCPDVGVACLYADYKDQANQTLAPILGTFLRQLLTTSEESIPDEVVQKLQTIQREGGKPAAKDNLALLEILLQQHQLKRAFICIDAVDELEPVVRRQLLSALGGLGTRCRNIHMFLTGRGHVESEVQKCLQVTQRYTVVISATEQDIKTFVGQQMIDDRYQDAMDELLEKEITDAITKKSQGMFLLPTLHVKMILSMPTKSQRRQALEKLPTDLYKSFQGIISRIQHPNASSGLGMRILMWLHFAYRPLKLAELQHALAVNKGHTEFDSDNIPSQKAILDCCLGLVIVDEETMTVRFVHFTLEEYFRENFTTEFPNGDSSIAETCLTYLTFGNLRQHCMNFESLHEMRTKYPFLKYAALYWGTYVKKQDSDSLTTLVRMLVEHENERPPCALQALYLEMDRDEELWSPHKTTVAKRFSGIHAIAYFGLGGNIVNFCEVDLKDDSGRTPLSWAAGTGHEAVVRLLVERGGVDINSRDSQITFTPLMFAAYNGHEAVVRLLVERDGVDINSRDIGGPGTPLRAAAYNGHEAVVRLLIERGVEINAKDDAGRTALMFAARKGHEAVVRLLTERGDVEINAKDNEGKIVLMYAAEEGHEAVVRLLIERDGEINAKDNEGKTALMFAAEKGHGAVVRLLIERDGEINAKDNEGKTALMFAAEKGHGAVVRLLIERDDVPINAKDNYGRTALMWAATCGRDAVVRLLIERDDVAINATDNEGKTALIWAAKWGEGAVVRLLIERGDVEINATDHEGKTALSWADASMKSPPSWMNVERLEAVVQLLNDRVDVLARGSDIAPDGALAGGVAGAEGKGASGATAA